MKHNFCSNAFGLLNLTALVALVMIRLATDETRGAEGFFIYDGSGNLEVSKIVSGDTMTFEVLGFPDGPIPDPGLGISDPTRIWGFYGCTRIIWPDGEARAIFGSTADWMEYGFYDISGGGLYWPFFMSSTNSMDLANLPGTTPDVYLNQGPFDATIYLNPDLQAEGWRAEFNLDVPDGGATIALLGLGLAGLAGIRARLR